MSSKTYFVVLRRRGLPKVRASEEALPIEEARKLRDKLRRAPGQLHEVVIEQNRIGYWARYHKRKQASSQDYRTRRSRAARDWYLAQSGKMEP